MPERWVLVLAEKYGRPPQEIEQEWEPYWTNRALIDLEAQGIRDKRREDTLKKKARR